MWAVRGTRNDTEAVAEVRNEQHKKGATRDHRPNGVYVLGRCSFIVDIRKNYGSRAGSPKFMREFV